MKKGYVRNKDGTMSLGPWPAPASENDPKVDLKATVRRIKLKEQRRREFLLYFGSILIVLAIVFLLYVILGGIFR